MEQQNQQKIGNPQTPVPTTTNMNDRDFVTDLLSTEKYMTSGYNTALNEFSHESLYQDIQRIALETQKTQRHLYDVMFKYGRYSVEAADPTEAPAGTSKVPANTDRSITVRIITHVIKKNCQFEPAVF